MKLTWFGGTTIRVHIGGAIMVVDPEHAPPLIDGTELVSGANLVIDGFGLGLSNVDPATWRPRRPQRLLDDTGVLPGTVAYSAGLGAILIDAVGEPPLLLVSDEAPQLGRWSDIAVIVLFGDRHNLNRLGSALLSENQLRLLVLAADEDAADPTILALRDQLDGTGLVALQAGMALEV